MANNALDYEPRYQWESSSGTFYCSQCYNCGPTGSTQQSDAYRGRKGARKFLIERTRTGAGVAPCRPTDVNEQVRMLEWHRIPASAVQIDTIRQLNLLLGDGYRRPVGIGVLMSRMTAATRGHSFLGWHRITILGRKRKFSWKKRRWINGYLYTDPNFSPPGGARPDPKKGRRWISQAALRYAYIMNTPRWAIVPDHYMPA